MRVALPFAAVLFFALTASRGALAQRGNGATEEEMQAILRTGLTQASWVGIHAAEALLDLRQPHPVREAFAPLADSTEPQYRVGVWRVLARAEEDEATREHYVRQIRAAELDHDGPDRLHAVEALAKLGLGVDASDRVLVQAMADSDEDNGSPFALWRLAHSGERESAQTRLGQLLAAEDVVTRSRAAYVLRHLRPWNAGVQSALDQAIAREPLHSAAHPLLITAAGGAGVIELARTATTTGAKYHAALALASSQEPDAEACLEALVRDEDFDVRIAAAAAWLQRRAAAEPRNAPGRGSQQ